MWEPRPMWQPLAMGAEAIVGPSLGPVTGSVAPSVTGSAGGWSPGHPTGGLQRAGGGAG